MRKNFVFIGLLFTLFTSFGPKFYMAAGLESSKKTVKTVAVLPFIISMDSNRLPKGGNLQDINLSFDNLYSQDKRALCKLLNVDAVIKQLNTTLMQTVSKKFPYKVN